MRINYEPRRDIDFAKSKVAPILKESKSIGSYSVVLQLLKYENYIFTGSYSLICYVT
jgi:hypothetical protein